ncbi:MAG: FtsW/RodA/SpoVE family cell cycle protein [Ruminococcus sp.]|nr:FtsW/RodA/SpoVE family cell cycle protein [Ruminococcus sp.]
MTKISDFFRKTDVVLWLLTIAAVVYSMLLISSMQRADTYNYVRPQLAAIVVGMAAAILISFADYRFLIRRWYIALLVGIAMIILVFIIGIRVEGTDDTAWIALPGGLSFQPSEFIKLCFIITFAKHLCYLTEQKLLESAFGVMTLAAHAVVPIVMIHVQGDDGTALIFGMIFLAMSYIAGVQLRYFLILGGLLLAGIPVIWHFYMNEEHRNRIRALFDLDGNAMTNYGWQQYQGKVSIAGGELTGSGLYHGPRVEYAIVPEQENDFILAVAGEETGFIGCLLLILLLFGIMIKMLINASNATEAGGKLLCAGVFASFASQTIINIGMVLGFFPVIGITLPLFSAGGTSVMTTLMGIGMVQSVRGHTLDDMETAKIRRGSQSRFKM